MPWQVPITVDGLEYPVTFNTEEQPTQQDLDEAVQQILSQRGQAPQPAGETPGYLSQLGSALGLGYRQMKSGVGATFNALTGDTADVAAEMAEMSKLQREQQAAQTPEDVKFMRSLEEAEKGFEQAQGPLESIGALAQYPAAVFAQPGAAFKTAVQSAPNALISGATSLAGYGLGGLVGGVAGIETGPGAILTGLAGATAGGALSNTLMEAGPSIFDVLNERTQGAASNMTADEIAAYLQQNPDIVDEGLKTGAIRGSVIGAVEALGVKGSGRLLTMPERAAARAVQKELMAQGVDVASKEAVDKALLDPALRASTKAVAETAKNQFSSAGNMARLAGASAIETGAAGAGELAAQAAAGQDISTKEAFLEMMGDAALSLPMAATTKALEGAKYMLNPALVSDLGKASAENLAATGSTAAAEAQEGFNEAIELAMLPFTREDIQATEMPFTREDIRATDLPFTREDIRATQLPFGREDIRAMEMPFSREDIRGISTPAQVAEEVGAEVTPSPDQLATVEEPWQIKGREWVKKQQANLGKWASDLDRSMNQNVDSVISSGQSFFGDFVDKDGNIDDGKLSAYREIFRSKGKDLVLEKPIGNLDKWKKSGVKNFPVVDFAQPQTPSPEMEMPSPPQGVDMASAPVSPIITEAPLSEGAERNRAVIAEAAAKLRGEAPKTISAGVKAAIPQQPVETQEDAAREIPLKESLRQEPQDRIESREAEETGAGDQLLRPAEGEEEVITPPAEPTTATESMVTPGGVATERDLTRPEQMTPEEWDVKSRTGITPSRESVMDEQFAPLTAISLNEILDKELPLKTIPQSRITAQGRGTNPKAAQTRAANENKKIQEKRDERAKELILQRLSDGYLPNPFEAKEIVRYFPERAYEFFDAAGYVRSQADPQRYLGEHALETNLATRSFKPVSIAAVDAYGIKLPEGYVKQGDLYVFQPQTTAAEKQTPVPLREGTGAAGIVQSEPVEGSIPTDEKVSPETESESSEKLDTVAQIDRLVQSGAKPEEMDKFIKSLSDDQFNELVASEAFDVEPKLAIKPKDTYDSKRIKRRKFVDAVNASTKEVRKTAQQVFQEEETAAKKQQAGEEMRSKAIDSIIGASEKKKRKFGQVTNSDAIAAVAMLVSSKDVPGVLTTWTGTKEDFLRDPANQLADPEIYARIKAGELVEGFFNKGRAYVFLDGIGVSDQDLLRGKEMGVSAQVAAVRRVLLHESLVHRGIHGLPLRHRRLILNWVRQNSTPAELDDLAKLYTEYANWRNSDYEFEALAEELLAKKVDSLTEIPKDGPMAKLMDILRQIWDFIVGYKREPTLSDLKSVVKLLKSGAEALANDRLKDGGEVKLSKGESPSSKANRKNSLRVKMTREALTEAALNQATWRDWYEEHQETLDEFFGDYAQQFQDILSVTSQAASVKANVGLALKAFGQWHRGEAFTGFLPAVIQNLNRLRDQQQIQGQKISTYKRNNDGTVDEAVIDRHITRLLFGSNSPTKEQFSKAQKVLAEVAQSIGWAPRQVQAALWAHSIYLSGKTPESYGAYLKTLDAKGTLSERIGELALRGSGGDAANRGRGRYSPAGITTDGIQRYNVGESQVRFSRPQFASDYTAAESAGSEAARSSIYSERDMDIREAIRRAYEAMPKQNSVAVPIGELFAKTEELMPGVTQEEFSLVLQDLFEDNGAVLQEGDSEFIVTTPEGRRAGFVVVMPRAAKASRIKAEDVADAAKTFQSDIIEAGKGRIDTASYQGNTLKSTEAPDHNVNAPELYKDAAISLVDSLLKNHSITDIADSFQDPEFRVAVGLLGNKAINPNVAQQAELFTGAVIQKKLEKALNDESDPAKKRLIEKTLKNHKAYYTVATGIGQNLNAVGALQQDPDFKGMFLFNEAEKEMADKGKDKLDTITGGGTQPVTDMVNQSEEAAADEATKQIEESVEEDEYANLVSEGEAELNSEEKGLWERAKMLLRRFAMYAKRKGAKAANAAKASLSPEQRKELDELNAIMAMSDDEAAKAEAKDRAEFASVLKKLLGEDKASDSPEQKKTRAKRKKMVDTAKKRAEAGKSIDISDTESAVKIVLREMGKARPGKQVPLTKLMPWKDILAQKAKTVEEYRQRILDAMMASDAFKEVSDEDKSKIADIFAKQWDKKRTDILDRMLEREIERKRREGSLSEAAAKALQKSRNKIIELANLGGFDNDDLMKVLGEKFGIKTGFSEAEKARISELADKLQDETLNPAKRNKLAMEFAVTLAGASEIPVSEIIANWWTSSVLFGPQTIFSIGAAFVNGAYSITTIGTRRMLADLTRGDVKGAIEESILMLQGIAKYLGAFKQAGRRAWSYLWTGNVDVLGAAANDILGEINSLEELKRFKRHKLLAENLAKDPRALRRYVGMYLRFVNRLLTSLDAFNVMVTKAGTASLALRMSGMSTDNIIKAEKMLNLKAYKDQVIRNYFDNKAPTTQAEKALVDSYAEAEMYRAVDQLGGKMENADYLASESAMTMNPTGLGGFFYRSITGLDSKMKKAAEDYLEKAKKEWTTEKDLESTLFLGLAYLRQFAVQNLGGVAGYKFIRFASNKFNQGISYLPMVGLLRTLEAKGDEIKGKEAFIETIHRNQVIGAVLTLAAIAVVKALEEEPDDEERGNFWNGGWQNLTPDQKKQMLAKGQKEYTMGFKFNGRWYVFNYQNWPLNQVLAAIGSMSDQIRFSPKQWEEKGPLSKSLAGIVSGLKSTLEIPALSQLGTLVGNRLASKDPTEQTVDRLSNVAAGWVGGFIPRILKDLDFATQPELRKYKTLWEKTASHIPIYRRYVGEDYYDILGQPIKRNVIPGSREFMMGPTEPEYKILGALNSRNIFLTPANAEYRMVGKGRNRRRLTQEEADAYSLETGKGYRQMLLRYGQRALQMPTERARAFLSDKADEARDRALKKVYRR